MNSEWIKKLERSVGSSERIITVSIDIRGFTPFSQSVESVDVGLYIKKIYLKILLEYFPDATFSKPMGDGLLIIMKYDEENLKKIANDILDRCIKLEEEFENLIKDDPMIPFETPSKIGIGITRGSSCCINVDGDIIDYSGKILNHANRLMEKARPSGIVCDYISFYNILEPELKDLFIEENVCLRGISETEPIKILILKDKVTIMEIDRRAINKPLWEETDLNYTCEFIKAINTKWFQLELEKIPLNPNDIAIKITIPKYIDNKKIEGMLSYYDYTIDHARMQHVIIGNKHFIDVDFEAVKNTLIETGVQEDDEIIVTIMYPI